MKGSYLKRYPLTHFIVAVVIILSMAPFPEVPQLEDISFADKWTHMIMYFGVSIVIWWEYLHQHQTIRWGQLIWGAMVAPAAMGGLLELAQAYLTTCRSGEWLDFVANCVGVLLGAAAGAILSKTCKG
ncbi:MAG: VanZ family protein [Bacteroidaceae bacterium]|nr:VanZ family protein [Bacteroidaceae bacterium]